MLRAQSERNAVAEQVCQLDQAIEHVQQEKAQRQHRLTELAPIVAKLNQVESLRKQVASLQAQLSAFSPDIGKFLHKIEERMVQLATTERSLPWLQAFAHERSELANALTEAGNARTQAKTLQATLQEYQVKRSQLNAQSLEAQKAERELFAAKINAHKHYEDVCERLRRFEDTAAQRVCELCGQEISEDYAEHEKTRLRRQIEEARCIYEEQQSLYQEAVDAQQHLEAEIAPI